MEPNGTWENRLWVPRRDGPGGGRKARRSFRYDAFIPIPVGDADMPLLGSTAELSARAERACRDLDARSDKVPSLEYLARQLLRSESVASSRIEGLVLSHRRLARAAFANDGRDQNAESVLGNVRAMDAAVRLAAESAEVTPDLLIQTHRALFVGTRDEHLGGVVRDEQNWIGGRSNSPRDAAFVPPPESEVPRLLEDLCAFCDRDDVPPIVQAGVAHAQFETIHPFIDGNGRVGRALIHVVLRRRGATSKCVPPVSLSLAGESDRYMKGLSDFRFGSRDAWIATFAEAVERAALGAVTLASRVLELEEKWRQSAGNPRKHAAASRLIEALPGAPILNVRTAQTLTEASDEATRLAIARLEEAGVLQPITVGRRNRAWECVGVFDLLDTFEREVGEPFRAPRKTSKG